MLLRVKKCVMSHPVNGWAITGFEKRFYCKEQFIDNYSLRVLTVKSILKTILRADIK